MSLYKENKTLEELKNKFAEQNLLLKSIKEVVEADAYKRLVSGLQLESWRKDEIIIKKGEKGTKL